MKFKIERHGIEIYPENEQDQAYLQDTLGLKKKESIPAVTSVWVFDEIVYLEIKKDTKEAPDDDR